MPRKKSTKDFLTSDGAVDNGAVNEVKSEIAGARGSKRLLRNRKDELNLPDSTENQSSKRILEIAVQNNAGGVDGIKPEESNSKGPKRPRKKQEAIVVKYETDSKSAEDSTENLNEASASSSNTPRWEPKHWNQVLENIRVMRKTADAPVDSMGCDKCMEDNVKPQVMRYQSLVSLMLSSQTKDEVTHAAMQRLHDHGCTIENILQTSDDVLQGLIYPVGFYKRKVQYIKKTSQILLDEYDGDIPNTVEKLCKLPGVGPKMAHLCMNVGWGVVTGIGVDTHVHRISNRIGWVRKETKTPEETRKALEDWLPPTLWKEVNHLLVGFGQQICRPVGPKCSECLNIDLCPFALSSLKPKTRK